jgi:hypothetical protein
MPKYFTKYAKIKYKKERKESGVKKRNKERDKCNTY